MRIGGPPLLEQLQQRTREAYRTNAPQRLPQMRQRALSSPHPLDQWQSALIAHIPREIRRLIWTNVLGGHLLHIVRAPKRLLAIECAESFSPELLQTGGHTCWGDEDGRSNLDTIPGFYLGPRENHPAKPANLLPLLQVCRIIYNEAISILYSNNIFDINHPDTFVYLQQNVLSTRLNRIRILNFTWDFHLDTIWIPAASYGIASWIDICEMLSSFTDLQELTIHLSGSNFKFDDLSERIDFLRKRWEGVFNTLRCITTVKKFDVFMPWSEEECVEVAKGNGYPFRLVPEGEVPYNSGPWDRDFIYVK